MRIHVHRYVEIAEDRLRVDKGHQIVVRDIPGERERKRDGNSDGGVCRNEIRGENNSSNNNKQVQRCDVTHVEICDAVGTDIDGKTRKVQHGRQREQHIQHRDDREYREENAPVGTDVRLFSDNALCKQKQSRNCQKRETQQRWRPEKR